MSETKEKQLKAAITNAFFLDTDYTPAEPLIQIEGSVIATEGSITTIGGLPKARKSTFMIGLLAAIFTGDEIFKFKAKKGKVVLVDTEQTKNDFARQMSLFKGLASKSKMPKDLKSFLFRQESIETIKESLPIILARDKPAYLIIDSITDLIYNVNDFTESKQLVQWLKHISMVYNVCIISIIHLSKTSNFTLGALGSALDRVSQSTLIVKKDKDSGQSFLEPLYLRSADDFKPVYINYNRDTNNYEVCEGSGGGDGKKAKFNMGGFTKENLNDYVNVLFLDEKELVYTALVDKCKGLFGIGDTAVRRVVIPYLVGNKFIKNRDSKYLKF